ncbi:lysophospholipase-like protein 1 [Branchiostoma floridae]|uniref:palmitoyl-protein hydrolase n=1 Tax=Branchiostoma floridae TaxID=7739 RepID=A0A9J7M981_BRAFL|nr:lysophospholipase-like protein 1 [Branchiostoma floridae]
MAAAMKVLNLQKNIVCQTGKHTASVIFLHGSGDTGEGVCSWIQDLIGNGLVFPHIRMVFPTAPPRPYTPMMGQMTTVWFDRHRISPDVPDHMESVDIMCEHLNRLIEEEVSSGIPKERIILGGFSMGGAMAMQVAYRLHLSVAGVAALSAFLNNDSAVYKAVKEANSPLPELFLCQGGKDPLVMPEWVKQTHRMMDGLGVPSQFHFFPKMYHEMCVQELELLRTWILKKLPS